MPTLLPRATTNTAARHQRAIGPCSPHPNLCPSHFIRGVRRRGCTRVGLPMPLAGSCAARGELGPSVVHVRWCVLPETQWHAVWVGVQLEVPAAGSPGAAAVSTAASWALSLAGPILPLLCPRSCDCRRGRSGGVRAYAPQGIAVATAQPVHATFVRPPAPGAEPALGRAQRGVPPQGHVSSQFVDAQACGVFPEGRIRVQTLTVAARQDRRAPGHGAGFGHSTQAAQYARWLRAQRAEASSSQRVRAMAGHSYKDQCQITGPRHPLRSLKCM
jgi:hypothetical protein